MNKFFGFIIPCIVLQSACNPNVLPHIATCSDGRSIIISKENNMFFMYGATVNDINDSDNSAPLYFGCEGTSLTKLTCGAASTFYNAGNSYGESQTIHIDKDNVTFTDKKWGTSDSYEKTVNCKWQ